MREPATRDFLREELDRACALAQAVVGPALGDAAALGERVAAFDARLRAFRSVWDPPTGGQHTT